MTGPSHQRVRRILAERLKTLRLGAGLSGERLAADIGWGNQSKVSKIETLRQLPSEVDIREWVAATGAPAGTVEELLEILRQARVEYADWKDAYSGGGAAGVQADILALEAGSNRIAEFQPSLISGLIQTPAYARDFLHTPSWRESFGVQEDDIERMIAKRMQRQQVLYETGRQISIVLLESALRCRVVSVPSLRGQLDRLISLSGLSTITLGIIPFEAQVPVWPLSGFRLYDDIVIVETIVGEQQLSDREDVARYESYLQLLTDAALTGQEAVPVIQRSMESLH